MTRRGLLISFVLATLAGNAVGNAAAQGTIDFRHEYRFLPHFSNLNESGGIAGRSTDFRIRGTFDFIDSTQHPADPAVDGFVAFDDVEGWASHPTLDYVLNVDQTLNLSGLYGTPIYVGPHGLRLYEFEGVVGENDVPVNLHVATLGRWLYMRGATDPPCCDFFKYKIRALAHQTPLADFDEDDEVGANDLAKWAQGFGLPALPVGGGLGRGDADGDGDVDGADFLAWQRQQGETPPALDVLDAMVDAALASVETATASAIPEPSTATLMAVGAALVSAGRGRRACRR